MIPPRATPRTPRSVTLNGRSYGWDDQLGLEPAVCLEIEGFIRKMAWLHASRTRVAGIDVEDLVQEGLAAALRAARRFNPEVGARYLTYAAPWIDAAMNEALSSRTAGTTLHGSRVWLESLDAPLPHLPNGEGTCLRDLQMDESPSAEALLEALEENRALRSALAHLTPKQRKLLVLHHGLDGSLPKSLPATAKALGVTRSQAEALHREALDRLAQSIHPADHGMKGRKVRKISEV